MWFLRFLLYLICALCLGWSVLVFGGPTLIKWALISYSDGRVTPSNITVTPDLDVRINRLDFDFSDDDLLQPFGGFSRSVNVDWSLFDDRAFLEVQLGPTFIENAMRAERIKFYTPSYENMDLDKILFDIEVENFSVNTFGKAALLKGQSLYIPETSILSDLSFKVKDLASEEKDLWAVKSAAGTVGDFSFDMPLDVQRFLVNLSVEHFSSDIYNLQVSQVNGDIKVLEEGFGFELNLADILSADLSGRVESVKTVGSLDSKGSINNVQAELFNGIFGGQSMRFSRLIADLSKTEPQIFTALFTTSLEKWDVSIADNYWGTLPGSRIDVELNLNRLDSTISAFSNLKLKDPGDSKISVLGQLDAKLRNGLGFWECASLQCAITGLNFDYQIDFGKEWIRGESVCASGNCEFGKIKNTIATSDTARVFEAISRSKVMSPFILAYIYAVISSGEPIGQGHKINF